MNDVESPDQVSMKPAVREDYVDDFVREDGVVHAAHWHLFIPTIIIAALYFSGWLVLILLGRIDTSLAKLFVIVLALGVPLLTIHAFLRFYTSRIQVADDHVRYHRGWLSLGQGARTSG